MPVRSIPVSHRSHVTGRQPFIPGTRSVAHESSLERDFVTLCRFDPDVVGIEEQPVTIHWIDEAGQHRRYTPDYHVIRKDCVEIVEIKYRSDLWVNWTGYKPAFRAASDWAVEQGMRFRILTDRQIRKPILVNAKRLVPRMYDVVPSGIEQRIVRILQRLQPVRFTDLVDAACAPEHPREVILSALWTMLARRSVRTDLDVKIHGGSVLRLLKERS